MKTYLAYKNQIQGFEDVSETVKTVEKIAASSVHFLKQEVASLNAYATRVEKVLARLSQFYQTKNHPLLQTKGAGQKAFLVLTGDKGLVGGLWHKLINALVEDNGNGQPTIIIVGTKGSHYLKEENLHADKAFGGFADIPQIQAVEQITGYIFDEFKNGTFSQVNILYPRFVSLAEQQASLIPFLPFKFNSIQSKSPTKFNSTAPNKTGKGWPIFEPSKQKIFSQLLQKYIGVFLHKIMMETKLSELSARTVAMEHASVKTNEFIQKLSLNYMKERRRAITQKQLESFSVHQTCVV